MRVLLPALLAASLLVASTAVPAREGSWRRHSLCLVADDPARAARRVLQYARETEGDGTISSRPGIEPRAKVVHIVAKTTRLRELAAELRRIDAAADVSWAPERDDDARRYESLLGELEPFEPFRLAMPFTAALLQRELDRLAPSRNNQPIELVTVAVGPRDADRAHLKNQAAHAWQGAPDGLQEMTRAMAELHGGRRQAFVSESDRATARRWEQLDSRVCSVLGGTVFQVHAEAGAEFLRGLARRPGMARVKDSCWSFGGRVPDAHRGGHTSQQYTLADGQVEPLAAWLEENAARVSRSEVAPDVDALTALQDRLEGLRAEAREQSDFLATRPVLRSLVASTAKSWSRQVEPGGSASRLVELRLWTGPLLAP